MSLYVKDIDQDEARKRLFRWTDRYGLKPLSQGGFRLIWQWLLAFEKAAPRLNLTAAKRRSQRLIQILDAIVLSATISKGPVLDLGSGAGIPGLLGAIYRPKIHFTLVEAVSERVSFMKEIIKLLGLANCQAETCHLGKDCCLPLASFATIISRGFGSVERFLRLAHPYVQEHGRLIYLLRAEVERETFPPPERLIAYRLPDGSLRYVLFYERRR
ncbi:16S rRNA (guanine(527)-N(7))-methyltransferase RsmG [Thermosulfuriphilus sp.]